MKNRKSVKRLLVVVSLLASSQIFFADGASPAQAAATETPNFAALDATMKEWITLNGIQLASLIVMKNGEVVHRFGNGGRDSSTPAPVGSLSKAITGVCIAHLVDEGRLEFSDTLGKILAPVFAKKGNPSDPRTLSITVEQLLTHRSGFSRDVDSPSYIALVNQNARPQTISDQFDWIKREKLLTDPGTSFFYSDTGYVVLGNIIETITGKEYGQYCKDTILTPMGVTNAKLAQDLMFFSPAAGWVISTEDYGHFMRAFDDNSPVLGQKAREWMDRQVGGGYGLGVNFKNTPTGGRDYWHSGIIRTKRSGSYSYNLQRGWIIEVNFQPFSQLNAYDDLNSRILSIFFPKK